MKKKLASAPHSPPNEPAMPLSDLTECKLALEHANSMVDLIFERVGKEIYMFDLMSLKVPYASRATTNLIMGAFRSTKIQCDKREDEQFLKEPDACIEPQNLGIDNHLPGQLFRKETSFEKFKKALEPSEKQSSWD